jgi:tetratricopeptide (TPR) repeat protein
MVGQLEQGIRVLEASILLLESAGDLETLAIALNNLASGYEQRGDLRLTLERGIQAGEIDGRVGNTAAIGFGIVGMGGTFIRLGDWEEAEEHIERGATILAAVGASWYAAYAPVERGHLRLRQGRWDEAARALEEALRLAQPIGDVQILEMASWLLGELELLEGRAEAARDRLEPLVSEDGPYVVPLLMTLAGAYLALDEVDRAEQAAERGLAIAKERHQRLYVPELLLVLGMILTRQRRWNEAEHAFEDAVSRARSMPYPYAEARALSEYAMLHRERGENEEARDRFEEALTIFRRLGAEKDVERTERALAALDRSPDPAR